MLCTPCQEEWNAYSGSSPLGPRTHLGTLGIHLSLALEVPSGVPMGNHKVPPCPMTQRTVPPTLSLSGPHFQLVGSHWQLPMTSTVEEPAPNSFNWLHPPHRGEYFSLWQPCPVPLYIFLHLKGQKYDLLITGQVNELQWAVVAYAHGSVGASTLSLLLSLSIFSHRLCAWSWRQTRS